jgi:hypothetical protein
VIVLVQNFVTYVTKFCTRGLGWIGLTRFGSGFT